jgi:peptidoglycan/xylan/chitin deacetylase (PgdA/CDA1 family)
MKLTRGFALVAWVVLSACRTSSTLEETGHVSKIQGQQAQKDMAQAEKLPPAPAVEPVVPEVISHGPRDLKQIALTFDACSTRDVSQYDERVTDVLLRTKTPATLFLGGSWARAEATHVRRLASNPLFELGNHTYTHPHLPRIQDEGRIRKELERTQSEVFGLTGVLPKFFRAPYGEYDDRVVKIAAELGLTTIEYDLASGDPDVHATKERLIEWVLRKAQAGSIIVMHINHLHFHTAEALPEIIQGLRKRGYTLVTVGQLLESSHANEHVAQTP